MSNKVNSLIKRVVTTSYTATDGSVHATERAACMHQYKLQLKALFESSKPIIVKSEEDAVNAIIKNPKQFRAAISRYINLVSRGLW